MPDYFWRAVDPSPFCYQVYDRYRADMFGHRRLLDKRPAEFKRNRVTAAIAEMKNRIRVRRVLLQWLRNRVEQTAVRAGGPSNNNIF
jgi:hypothetical protein